MHRRNWIPGLILPILGADYGKWITVMATLAVAALPLTLVEYFYTKERVTEAAVSADKTGNVPLREQL